MQRDLKKLINVLRRLSGSNQIHAFPERKRKIATDTLNSNEILHLAEHIIKIILWPKSQWTKGWLTEIKASLDNLAFGLSRYTRRIGTKRYVEKLWYSSKTLMEKVNDIHDTAYWNVIKAMEKEIPNIEKDPFNEYKDLYEIGYTLKEEKDIDKGIIFSLYFKGKKLV